jgi:hypothetical protein
MEQVNIRTGEQMKNRLSPIFEFYVLDNHLTCGLLLNCSTVQNDYRMVFIFENLEV